PASDNGAALVANANNYNINIPPGTQGSERGLMAAPSMESAMLNVTREFGSRVQAFVDVGSLGGRGSSYNSSVPNSVTNIPVTSPFKPFQQAINVRFPTPGYAFKNRTESTTVRATGGVIVRLPADWTTELDYGWNRSRNQTTGTTGVFNTAALSTPLRTGLPTAGNPALNALQEANTFPQDFTPYMIPTPNFFSGPFDTVLKDATVHLSGPVLTLPGGRLMLSALVERRNEEVRDA